jgi:hypothetical protein
MSFRNLTKMFLALSPQARENACIEYFSLTGPRLGAGHMAQETVFSIKGNGDLEFFRRGDFGERSEVPPGLWRAKCTPVEVKDAWMIFGELTQASFPARVADPGDSISRLDGYAPDQFESLTWGPPEPGAEIPGDEFLEYLAPLMNRTLESQPLWAVEMALKSVTKKSNGLELTVVFKNPGTTSIGLFLPSGDGMSGFQFRHAIDRDAPLGVTPLPVEWEWIKAQVPGRESDSLWTVPPVDEISLSLFAPLTLEPGSRYLAKLQYQQLGPLDMLAGNRILSGTCFSEVLEFDL